MKLRNIITALRDQGPLSRFLRNLWRGYIFGLIHKRSHYRDDGLPKVEYHSKAIAIRAAESMKKKRGVHFSNYKCMYCDGYHIGKNFQNKIPVKELS